jgi:hypothetical protein
VPCGTPVPLRLLYHFNANATMQIGSPSAANFREDSNLMTFAATNAMNATCSSELRVKQRTGLSWAQAIERSLNACTRGNIVKDKIHTISTIASEFSMSAPFIPTLDGFD